MTDRYAGFLVVLEENAREDDAQAVIAAIRQIRGVLSVEPMGVDLLEMQIAEKRVRLDLEQKIWGVLHSK
jgi:hypothetical protein